jgi:hypothetical protein
MILSKLAAIAADPHFISAIVTAPQPAATAAEAQAQAMADRNSILTATFICASFVPLVIFYFADGNAEKVEINFLRLNFSGLNL